jgi:hypothetical protein
VCCNDKVIRVEYNTSACCENRDAYNYETHICCNGTIQTKQYGDQSACCGDQQYNYEELRCCYWYDVFPSKEICIRQPCRPPCCGTPVGVYNASAEICCNGTIEGKLYQDNTSCCGSQQFNYQTDICCDQGQGPINKTYGDVTGCCGSTPYNYTSTSCCYPSLATYDTQSETCCNGTVLYNPFGEYSACCGTVVYNWSQSLCCNDRYLYSIPSMTRGYYCCGDDAYDYGESLCCYGCI